MDTWSRDRDAHTKTCIYEDKDGGCQRDAIYPRRYCREHRNLMEMQARKQRKDGNRGKTCVEVECDQPRYEADSQVMPRCKRHHLKRSLEYQRKARKPDFEPRQYQPPTPEVVRAQVRDSQAQHRGKRRYGVDYREKYAEQEGRCASCGDHLLLLSHDHCHSPIHLNNIEDSFRGLLCPSCNIASGRNFDDPAMLEGRIKEAREKIRRWELLIDYLEPHLQKYHSQDPAKLTEHLDDAVMIQEALESDSGVRHTLEDVVRDDVFDGGDVDLS